MKVLKVIYFVLFFLLFTSIPGYAATLYMSNSGNDSGNNCQTKGSPCLTLTHAVSQASAGDTINIESGTYKEAGLIVDFDLTITGDNKETTVIDADTDSDGTGNDTIFEIKNSTFSISDLTLQNGMNRDDAGGAIHIQDSFFDVNNIIFKNNRSDYNAGAMYMYDCQDSLITNSSFINNQAEEGGGALFIEADVNITDSLFQNNSAYDGGAIYIDHGIVTLEGITIEENQAGSHGGGIYNYVDLLVTDSVINNNTAKRDGGGNATLHNVTVANNIADSEATGTYNGGGVFICDNVNCSITVENSIIASNESGGEASDCYRSTDGTVTSNGYNIISAASLSCPFTNTGDIQNISANSVIDLELKDNGGFTKTHALIDESAAIEGGNPTGCLDHLNNPIIKDQRGAERPSSVICDSGAFELGRCGDAFIGYQEECDDGNTSDEDGCSSSCQIETTDDTGSGSETNTDSSTTEDTAESANTNATSGGGGCSLNSNSKSSLIEFYLLIITLILYIVIKRPAFKNNLSK